MAVLLKIVDEHFGSGGTDRRPAVELHLVSERITAREILQRRVEAEVESVNARRLAHAKGHANTHSLLIDVDPQSAEDLLNRLLPPSRKARLARVEVEVARAALAFEKQRFIMLLDERQIEGLDDEVTLRAESQLVFLYLSPLKGG